MYGQVEGATVARAILVFTCSRFIRSGSLLISTKRLETQKCKLVSVRNDENEKIPGEIISAIVTQKC